MRIDWKTSFICSSFKIWIKWISVEKAIGFENHAEFVEAFMHSHPNIQNPMFEYFQHGFLMSHNSESLSNLYAGELKIRYFVSLLKKQVEWINRIREYIKAQSRPGLPMRDELPDTCTYVGRLKAIAQLNHISLIYVGTCK